MCILGATNLHLVRPPREGCAHRLTRRGRALGGSLRPEADAQKLGRRNRLDRHKAGLGVAKNAPDPGDSSLFQL
jgi:hypothetical protein